MSETTQQTSDATQKPGVRCRLLSSVTTRTTKRLGAALIVIAALIAGFSLLRSGALSAVMPKSATPADEIVIASRSMTFWVDATGTLRASSVRNFSAPPPFGEYWQFQIVSLAPEGGNVKTGDSLINFDAQKVREDLQRFQSELDQANKELEKMKVSIDLERQELSSKLAAAENKSEKLKLKQGAGSDIEASNVIEKDNLAVEQARREVEALKDRMEWHKKASEASYNIIGTRKARAENRVNAIQKGMEGFQAKADRDGVVVYKVKWNGERYRVGENVWSGMPIIEIPELNTILAEALVPEVDIGKVNVGQHAEVAIDAFPGRTFAGNVKSIGTLVRPKAWDIPNKVLDVQIALDQLDIAVMRPAMSIRVKIETNSVADCFAVPLKAVLTTAEGAVVKVKSDAGWRTQKVKLGDSNGADIIVTEGLNAGDRVAADFLKAK
ncbi:MAG TPA: efflux RND transporter periplasmic adaptor subunit [Blastocatellia bacterium]|nr:efflux RND transporter periplasmic adaptor subunit [Blastocatellia bacterium]